jgi:hypothetical protein
MPLGSRGVAVEHVLNYAAGELVLAEKDLPNVFLYREPASSMAGLPSGSTFQFSRSVGSALVSAFSRSRVWL